MLKKLSEELIKGGYEADTPAAIVYKATWPDEKRVVCTVATLAEAAERENIKKTALIIVGDVTRPGGRDAPGPLYKDARIKLNSSQGRMVLYMSTRKGLL